MQTYVPPLWIVVLPVLLLVGGGLLRRWIGRRRFERTNQFGVEEFDDYGQMRRAQSAESCLGCVGLLAVVVGLALLLLVLATRCFGV